MSTRSLRVRQNWVESAKLAVRRNGFVNQRALAEEAGLAIATVSNFLTGKPVDRATFVELCQKLSLNPEDIADLEVVAAAPQTTALSSQPLMPQLPTPTVDWGEALDVSLFYGRDTELVILQQWILDDQCQLVMLLGMGGIGKTALSVRLAEQLQAEFECVIWRSLRNAPPVQELLADLLSMLAPQRELALPDSISGSITRLLEHLRTRRCLLVLDNAESILGADDDRAGMYREGYAGYGQLLQCVGETRHRSCLVLTSREKPSGLGAKEGQAIRSLKLTGLGQAGAQAILQAKGVTVPVAESRSLIEHYAGNPLALKIVATTIQDLFEGDVAQFLAQGTGVFGDISDLLEQQWQRLSALEQQVMVWLGINREGILLADLKEDIIPATAPRSLMETLESLQQRSLIEKITTTLADKKAASFTQQPVVMEYVTEQLVRQVCEALVQGDLVLLHQYALSKAQTKDYLRQAQQRLILTPLVEQLKARLGSQTATQACLQQTLARLQAQAAPQAGYAAGNLLKLLSQLKVNLSDYDFSHLPIWQVYLQGVPLQHVNFTGADFTKSVFTQTLGDILAATFSPDGKLLATGIDRDVLLWEIAGTRQLATLAGHTAWITSIAFSPDGNVLASSSNDHTIRLYDVSTGQCLITLRGHTSGVQAIAFSPDGNLLASSSNDHTIRLWDVETRQCVQVLKGHTERVLSVLFSPDNQTLISSGDDKTIRLWKLQSGACQQTITTHVNWVLAMALSPDGKTLVAGSDSRTVKFWNLETFACVGTLPSYKAKVWAVAFSPDGRVLATGSDDKTVRLWDVYTKQCLKTWHDHTHQVWLVKFSPDGQTLVSSGDDQTVKLWDVQTGQCLTTLESYSNWVSSIAFSPDDRTLVSSSKDQLVRLWHTATGHCTNVLQGHTDVVTSVAFHPCGQTFASGSDDCTIKVWDATTGDCLRTFWGHIDWVQAIAFSPDGQTLASASCDKTVKVWEARSGECLQTLQGHTHRVKAVAFSPDGTLLASGSDDQTIRLWNISSGTCLRTLSEHTDWVLSVAFSPCGQWLASGSGDRTIKLWQVQSGECFQTLKEHSHRVRSVAFSRDGILLASGSEDQLVKLWEVQTGKCLTTVSGHQQIVWTVVFDHQGQRIASCSEDGTIRMWDVRTSACQKILRVERPYEDMDITGAIGLTLAQKATLKALGAIEREAATVI